MEDEIEEADLVIVCLLCKRAYWRNRRIRGVSLALFIRPLLFQATAGKGSRPVTRNYPELNILTLLLLPLSLVYNWKKSFYGGVRILPLN